MKASHDFLVVHTSDVHVDDDDTASRFQGDGTEHLRQVIAAVQRLKADVLLLAGDTFDHNRLPRRVLERAAALLAAAPGDVVALPGNHDPATENSVFRHSAFSSLRRLHVIGVNRPETVRFDAFGLEIWGRPHRDFGDMAPLDEPPARASRWRIAMAHGHYEARPDRAVRPRASWLFGDEDLAASEADYIALGHWNRRAKVGMGSTPAWYSGSPDYARSVNVCRFSSSGLVVTQESLAAIAD